MVDDDEVVGIRTQGDFVKLVTISDPAPATTSRLRFDLVGDDDRETFELTADGDEEVIHRYESVECTVSRYATW